MYNDVQCGTIHNNQALETTKVPYNWWVDQEFVYIDISIYIYVYTYRYMYI
jgi:hypothetical protein